jgi:hypothetical protein
LAQEDEAADPSLLVEFPAHQIILFNSEYFEAQVRLLHHAASSMTVSTRNRLGHVLKLARTVHLFALQVRESVLLHMPDSLPAWAAFLQRQEDRAGPSLVKRTVLH